METKYKDGIMTVDTKKSDGYLIIKNKHGEVIVSKPTIIEERIFTFKQF